MFFAQYIKNIKGDVFILKNTIYRRIWENVHKKPYDTEGIMDITKIKIPHYYFTTEPHDEKVKKYYGYYLKHKHLDKAITVSPALTMLPFRIFSQSIMTSLHMTQRIHSKKTMSI